MKIYQAPIGNLNTSEEWRKRIDLNAVIYLDLDQWNAQKSRFKVIGSDDQEYAVALDRHVSLTDGDILDYFPEKRGALVVRIALSEVLEIDLSLCLKDAPSQMLQRGFELGHALGNQHWPAVIKGAKVYVPLTVDRTVMRSVMETHHFEHITYNFKAGREIIPFLAPHEVRRLFGASEQNERHHHPTE